MINSSKFLSILKWGALLGAGLSLIKLISYLTLNIDYPFGPVADLLMIASFILCLYMGIKEVRDKHQDGIIRFPRAFLVGIFLSFVAFLVVFAYLLLHFNFIEKDALEAKNQRAIERAEELVKKDTITTAELAQYYARVSEVAGEEAQAMNADSATIDGVGLALTALKHQLVERARSEGPELYRLDSFNFKAEELLFHISRNLNGVDSSAQSVLASVQAELHSEPTVWEQRLSKLEITRIDSIPVAAAADSLSVLIYGFLLNIFVALFLYRKEKNQCSAPVEITPGRDRELEEDEAPKNTEA